MTAFPAGEVRAVFPPSGARAVPPKHTDVWVYIDREWRPARLVAWLMVEGPSAVLLHWSGDAEPDTMAYAYGDGAIRYRDSDIPPDRWRQWCTLEEIRPFLRRPHGSWVRIGPKPACPGCGAWVDQAADNLHEWTITFSPCGHRLEIYPTVEPDDGPWTP
jgi:hypothetical protein